MGSQLWSHCCCWNDWFSYTCCFEIKQNCESSQGFKNPKIKVVTIDWIYKCIASWEHVSEDNYILKPSLRDNIEIEEESPQNLENINDMEDVDTEALLYP